MILTVDTYHSPEMERKYMTQSQFASWLECPAATASALASGANSVPTQPMLIGSYVDSLLLTPDTHDQWMVRNESDLMRESLITEGTLTKLKPLKAGPRHGPMEIKGRGEKMAGLNNADSMVARCQGDELFMSFLEGQKQAIWTGSPDGYGCDWKVMLDSVDLTGEIRHPYYTDLKTTKSMSQEGWMGQETIFDILAKRRGDHLPRKWQKGPFYEQWPYWRQLTIAYDVIDYNEDVQVDLYLAVISKEQPADIGVLSFEDHGRIHFEREFIKSNIDTILAWKANYEPPPRCERCDFCRGTKMASVVEARSFLFT